jgi:hypothetical protein
MQSIDARFAVRGPTNQEVGVPPFLSFPHIMLSVEKVKNNMQLAFIEKLL